MALGAWEVEAPAAPAEISGCGGGGGRSFASASLGTTVAIPG